MTKTLYIIRGLPGSGKSTLARQLAQAVFSEDDYWTAADGSYHFDPATRKEAFENMSASAYIAMGYGFRSIALATAALSFDASPLDEVIKFAESHGYTTQLIFLPLRPGRASIHNVSEADTARFLAQMDHGLTVNI